MFVVGHYPNVVHINTVMQEFNTVGYFQEDPTKYNVYTEVLI